MRQVIFITVMALLTGFLTFAQANPPAGAMTHAPSEFSGFAVDQVVIAAASDADHTLCGTDNGCSGCEIGLANAALLDRLATPARRVAAGPRQSTSPIREILKPPRA